MFRSVSAICLSASLISLAASRCSGSSNPGLGANPGGYGGPARIAAVCGANPPPSPASGSLLMPLLPMSACPAESGSRALALASMLSSSSSMIAAMLPPAGGVTRSGRVAAQEPGVQAGGGSGGRAT